MCARAETARLAQQIAPLSDRCKDLEQQLAAAKSEAKDTAALVSKGAPNPRNPLHFNIFEGKAASQTVLLLKQCFSRRHADGTDSDTRGSTNIFAFAFWRQSSVRDAFLPAFDLSRSRNYWESNTDWESILRIRVVRAV